ncbi:uncharacterized protein AMSG_07694 [Thecamonas trahens ATCC 50062]|uniref:Cyclin-like domain-containing protein n=1 Tax=Thecamonas trahens ATCC 50062 TaxID=461836 RepID=A0A0L0DH83_THETB|nr:hypothetical protein AMSG_07694 [Thecamonas trahens ATCC 50062]KNC51496.1 hypothetical protein AMSG_07694 [Thecamonas trahens ATCC 50062]|eukprot:XP_013756154.1 hypothetical protein AMSG_07694 [Thecamonas trahens ATCC 50062]
MPSMEVLTARAVAVRLAAMEDRRNNELNIINNNNVNNVNNVNNNNNNNNKSETPVADTPAAVAGRREMPSFDGRYGREALAALLAAERKYSAMRRRQLTPSRLTSRHVRLNCKMRAIVVSWLMEVSAEYRLTPGTCHLAITLFDNYLAAARNVPRNKLQLIGVTALFIAAKLEEVYPPTVSELADVTDRAYSEDEIRGAERALLATLRWELHPPTVPAFVAIYLDLDRSAGFRAAMAAVDAVILDLRVTAIVPASLMAAAAVYVISAGGVPGIEAVLDMPSAALVDTVEVIIRYADDNLLHLLAESQLVTDSGVRQDDQRGPVHPVDHIQNFSRPDLQQISI